MLIGLGKGSSPVTPYGTQVRIYDTKHTLLGHREFISNYGNVQPNPILHFGGLQSNEPYVIDVFFTSSSRRLMYRNCRPIDLSTTVGNVTRSRFIQIYESLQSNLVIDCGCNETNPLMICGVCQAANQASHCTTNSSCQSWIDICGICGGNGTSCLNSCDTKNPYRSLGVRDKCGVCGGDNSSCECTLNPCGVCGPMNSFCSGKKKIRKV